MKIARPDLAALALVALCVTGAVVLVALGVAVPDFLTFAGTTALGIAGGSYLPQPSAQENLQGAAASSSGSTANPPVAAPPLPYEPTTGIIPRVSTHAP